MPGPPKKKPTPPPGLRDLFFGDLPLTQWPLDAGPPQKGEPWASFRQARGLIDKGDAGAAKGALNRVLEMPRLESRHYLEAWQHLRGLGQTPPASERKRVLGVVVEVGLAEGLDIVAAYEDGSARYMNFSGAGVVWERPDASLDASIQALLAAARAVAAKIGPSPEPRPPAPASGRARINMLTPSGLHFGEGPAETLFRDPVAGPVLREATGLMQALIAKSGHGV